MGSFTLKGGPHFYVLRDRVPVRTDDVVEWFQFFTSDERHLAHDVVGDETVSTIFLGIDVHRGALGEPLFFETLAFGNDADGAVIVLDGARCSTYDEALTQHAGMIMRAVARTTARARATEIPQ